MAADAPEQKALLESVANAWSLAAKKCAPELLWGVYAHFERESHAAEEEVKLRIFNTKRDGKSFVKSAVDNREPIPPEVCELMKQKAFEVLKEKYAEAQEILDTAFAEVKKVGNKISSISVGKTVTYMAN